MDSKSRPLVFALLSFEGPDPYSRAGGLGVRVSNLAAALAAQGHETHLFFIGEPEAPGVERYRDGVSVHRWCQWISAHHPEGVYAGEEEKLRDWNRSLPSHLIDHVVQPALRAGRLPVILAEEWHTAESMIRLSDLLFSAGIRDRAVLCWNANNTKSFDRIDWPRLHFVAQLMTVSRYMKHRMWAMGVNPMVVPNGIPAELIEPVSQRRCDDLRRALGAEPDSILLFKTGRFDPDKRWLMALEAAARLKSRGYEVVFPLSGGVESHAGEVFERARSLGLSVAQIDGRPSEWDAFLDRCAAAPRADIYHLQSFLDEDILRVLYASADAVLANSGHEPFGLVGLETMAAGGLAFTGATGEEYAVHGRNAIVLETSSPDEIIFHLEQLRAHPERGTRIRAEARRHAGAYQWDRMTEILLEKIAFAAALQDVTPDFG